MLQPHLLVSCGNAIKSITKLSEKSTKHIYKGNLSLNFTFSPLSEAVVSEYEFTHVENIGDF